MGSATGSLVRPFVQPIESARSYSLYKLRKDLVAGLTVSVVEVPQAMAYALVAGVPAQYGLYASIIQGVIGALLSSSQHLTTGPTNTQALLVAATVTRLVEPTSASLYLELVFGLTFLKGLIQLAFAAARFGEMVRYVSQSVIVGVAAGAGVLIAIGQLPNFLGIELARSSHRLPGALGTIERMWPHAWDVNAWAVGIGVLSLLVWLGARWISRFMPAALLAIVAGAIAVWASGAHDRVPVIGALPRAFPQLHVPMSAWTHGHALFAGALALATLGILEAVAIAKTLAAHSGERVNANQEIFTQGMANLVSSFAQCIPGSASFTRSALDYSAGAQTRFGAVYNAIFVAIIFFALGAQARYVPFASLAAVLFVIAWRLIDWTYIARIARTSRADTLVCLVTFLATILAPLEYAIFVGIAVNIAVYLRTASRLHVAEMVPAPGSSGETTFLERPVHERHTTEPGSIVFLQLEGELFFAVADELQDHLASLQRGGAKVVILRLKRTHSIDASVLNVLDRFAREMRSRDAHVILCGLRPELMAKMRAFGLIKLLGEANVFETGGGVFTSAKRALQRAREIAGAGALAAVTSTGATS